MLCINKKFHLILAAACLIGTGCDSDNSQSQKRVVKTEVKPVPAAKFDLNHWLITMPDDLDGNGLADNIDVAEIKNYSHPDFFFLNDAGLMVFTSPNKGTTSPTSTNTRSELRYMSRGLDTSIGAQAPSNNFALASNENAGQYASIGGMMEATLHVDHVSLNAGKPNRPPAYSVVIGQIHAAKQKEKKSGFGYGNEPLKIFFKKWPHHKTGSIFWTYERNLPVDDPNRIDIVYGVWGNTWENSEDPGELGIALGEKFSYTVNVHEDMMYLIFENEKQGTVRYNINLADNVDANGEIDNFDHPLGYSGEPLYFKAGTYNQCSTKISESFRYPACPGTGVWEKDQATGDYAQSTFYKLSVSESVPM